MLLIISSEYDVSTDQVIDWLNYYSIEFTRINKEAESLSININNSETSIKLLTDNRTINFNSISSFWYRKNGIEVRYNKKGIINNKRKKSI